MTEQDGTDSSCRRETGCNGAGSNLVLRDTESLGDPETHQRRDTPCSRPTFSIRDDGQHVGFGLDDLTHCTAGRMDDGSRLFLRDAEVERGAAESHLWLCVARGVMSAG